MLIVDTPSSITPEYRYELCEKLRELSKILKEANKDMWKAGIKHYFDRENMEPNEEDLLGIIDTTVDVGYSVDELCHEISEN